MADVINIISSPRYLETFIVALQIPINDGSFVTALYGSFGEHFLSGLFMD